LALNNRKSKGNTFVLPHSSKISKPVKSVMHTSHMRDYHNQIIMINTFPIRYFCILNIITRGKKFNKLFESGIANTSHNNRLYFGNHA